VLSTIHRAAVENSRISCSTIKMHRHRRRESQK
jgi:hypothetical protein